MQNIPQSWISRAKTLGLTPPYSLDLDHYGDAAQKGLKDYLDKGHHGSMAWLEQSYRRRGHPHNLWPEAKSALIFGLNYGPDSDPLETLGKTSLATISVYARNKDYHGLFKGRLKEIAGLIARDTQKDVKVFVDTAPLMEKPLAMAAGLGWQGKHTNLVSRDYGSWLFLGIILSAASLPNSAPQADHCGQCRACLDICPTQAFPKPYQLDARRCISYLTIEHTGPIALEFREKLGNRIYGCDDCLAICPWNKFAQHSAEIKLTARADLNAPSLADLSGLGPEGFRQFFSGSAIKRIGWPRFLRNILYAIGNSGDTDLAQHAMAYKDDPDFMIADAANWALDRLDCLSQT